jgi:hypothetical protein
MRGFLEAALESRRGSVHLSTEHTPPKALGGLPLVLTCSDCNSRSGHQLDADVAAFENLIDHDQATMRRPSRGVLEVDGLRVNVEFQAFGRTEKVEVMPDSRGNPPGAAAGLEALLRGFTESVAVNDLKVVLTPKGTYFPRRVTLGWARSAYLLAFALLGYGYIRRPAVQRVREQILANTPDGARIAYSVDPSLPANRREMGVITRPDYLRGCVLVHLGRHSIILPGLDENDPFEAILREEGDRPVQIALEANRFPWPVQAEFYLDFPQRLPKDHADLEPVNAVSWA